MNMKQTNLLLLGGGGRMGRMLTKRWATAGYSVQALEPGVDNTGNPAFSQASLQFSVTKADIIVLCVPVGGIAHTMFSLAPFLEQRHILIDITSVKSLPMQIMEASFKGAVIGTHPLFGPEPKPEENKVALTRGIHTPDAAVASIETLFHDIGCVTFFCTPKEHDTATAIVQSLNFVSSAAYFTVANGNPRLREFITPSFERYANASQKFLTKDTAMFCEFTMANPYFADTIRQFTDLLTQAGNGELPSVAAKAAAWYAHEPK